MDKSIRLSVHQLVDFLLRSGDIDNRVFNRSSMSEGTRLHASYQSKQGSNYLAEYPLKKYFYINELEILLEGRADGIIKKGDEYTIDEIKTTVIDLLEFRNENLEWHLGQAKCYAYMFLCEQDLKDIGVRLTYIKQGKEKEKYIDNYLFTKNELEQFVYSLIEDYFKFYEIIERKRILRDESIKKLEFPFPNYRDGQKELAKYAYALTKQKGRLFVEAPTGIGKTMSTLFPFIKSLVDDDKSKIFYLTAKNSGKEAAFNAVELLKQNKLLIDDIVITAKEKICLNDEIECNPDKCEYAKNYYDKIQSVLTYSLTNESTFSLEKILEIAKENKICPFELELDLSLFCDVIICDYNYMFDPISYMKRYFDEDCSHHLALIDEAHNLIERSKDMYSATIHYESFLKAKKSVKNIKKHKIKRHLNNIKKMFEEIEILNQDDIVVVDNFSIETYHTLELFIDAYQDLSKEDSKLVNKDLKDFYLEANEFLKISEFYSHKFLSYFEKNKFGYDLNLYCLDASTFLRSDSERIKASLYFSATLSPIDYYVDTLGGDKQTDPTLLLASPFDKKNFNLLIAPKVSIKYRNRDASYAVVKEYIEAFIKSKVGNYFIYSPSYEYMNNLLDYLDLDDVDYFVQSKDMKESDKLHFLDNFVSAPRRTTLGFLVIGGSFSEGVDLVADRLIGAVIIGIGLSKINFKSDKIAEYYQANDLPGRDYAYTNPGMNKVMQAVGRVIRTESDRGGVLLIDERYMSYNYQRLFKAEWSHYKLVYTPEEVEKSMKRFFEK